MIVSISKFSEQFPGIASNTDEQELSKLLAAFSLRVVPKNSIILKEGEHSSSLHLIWRGVLSAYIDNEGETVELGRINAGQWVGEVSILDPGPTTASVIAETDCILLTLTEESFRILDQQYPTITTKILRMLSTQLIKRINTTNKLLYDLKERPPQESEKDTDSISEWSTKALRMMFGNGEEA